MQPFGRELDARLELLRVWTHHRGARRKFCVRFITFGDGGDYVSMDTDGGSEPPRDYGRLHFVRTWSHGEVPNTSI